MVVGAWYGRVLALVGGLVALVPALAMWGFTVDDALIPLRYAHHLAAGAGYRFNVGGPVTDGVTPLVWAPLLAALGGDLVRAKVLGVVAWTFGGVVLGHSLAARRLPTALSALVVVGLSFSIGAWAASGMETGVATALATIAACRPKRAPIFAGLAALFRPELVVWAVALSLLAPAKLEAPRASDAEAFAPAPLGGLAARTWTMRVLAAVTPFLAVVAIRLAVFGRPAPLALLAKPSDFAHGFSYAIAGTIAILTPILCVGRVRSPAIVVAFAVHVLVVMAVGGDWMPYSRLLVPVAPTLALAAAEGPAWATIARTTVAAALGIALIVTNAARGRSVYADRNALIAVARPALASSRVIAALDVGWVGASTEADIVDLAGLTDPAIASLRGGHTSKAVDLAMLLERNVDTIVIYAEPRNVEQRILGAPLFDEHFVKAAELSGSSTTLRYDLYRRRFP